MKRRDNGKRHTPPKEIRCGCGECRNRTWSLAEIRDSLDAGGHGEFTTINGLTLPKIAKLLGHPLRYLNDTPAGKWTPSAPVAREDGTKTPWMHNTDEAAYEVEFYARNPMRMTAELDSGREPEGGR